MYVADESDGKVYSYNLPDAIDARLATLTLSGVDFGEFLPGRTEYDGVAAEGVTETTVEAAAMQRRTRVAIDPVDSDGDEANGHQITLAGTRESHTHTHTDTHTQAHTDTQMHTDTLTHTHKRTQTHTHDIHRDAYKHTHTLTHTHTLMHTHTNAHRHTHDIHTNTRTQIHRHTHGHTKNTTHI